MMTPLHDTWQDLIREASAGPAGLRLRLLSSAGEVRAFAAVTAGEGLPGILLEFHDSARPRSFRALITRAFEMSAPPVKGLPAARWAVLVELKDRAFSDLFEVLANEVLNAIQSKRNGEAGLLAVLRCIERWRRFVERKGEPLSAYEVQGLIGELVVLCRCVRLLGPDAALAAWSGPDRALRDFELPDASVEVKTFQGDDAATVVISSPDQLDAVAERPAFLAAVRLTPSDAHGSTLSEFVALSLRVIGHDAAAAGTFEERLATVGYLAAHASLYVKRFIAGPVQLYEITRSFPRIRSVDVPQGVLAVKFALSIPALKPFLTDAAAVIGGRVPETEAG